MAADPLFSIALALAHLFLGLVSSILSVFLALWLLNKITGHLNEWEELKEGNIAIGILFLAVILSVLIMIAPTALSSIELIKHFRPFTGFFINLVLSLANIFLASIFSVFTLYISFMVEDKITYNVDEMKEFKKGNIAIALMIGALLIGIAIVTAPFINDVIFAINLAGFAR